MDLIKKQFSEHRYLSAESISNMLSFLDFFPDKYQQIHDEYIKLVKLNQTPSGQSVREPILNSWIRSKNYNVNPNRLLLKKLNNTHLNMILKDNETLLHSSAVLLTNLASYYSRDKYLGFSLYDKNGYTLFAANSALKGRGVGDDLSEEAVGTTSHTLCINLENPVYVLSPENYHPGLQKPKVTFSIPIHNSNGKIIAALTIPYFSEIKYTSEERSYFSSIMALLFMTAINIEQAYFINSSSRKIMVEKSPCDYFSHNKPKPARLVDNIPGDSVGMLKAKEIAKKVASTPKSILLLGESGTGKEVFAKAIHEESRPEGPFIAVNCAALPKSLLESELFGYEGGSFTGADKKGHIGKIEMANCGTLFLDEIGDMPLALQAVLLRVLEDKKIMRIGGTEYIDVDFRVVAATNRDLIEMIRDKKFREDLYYRIATFEIFLPPLRQRNRDILHLAKLLIKEECSKMKIRIPKLDEEVVRKIQQYEWPGNVRELKSAMEYALTMSVDGKITMDHLPRKMMDESLSANSVCCKPIEEIEKEAILKALAVTHNNVKNVAELLHMSRTTLYRKLKEYNISLK